MNVSVRPSALIVERNADPNMDPHSLCTSAVNKTVWRTPHQIQMDGFLYTVFILAFYALTMLYFMLRQICRQERRSRNRFYQLRIVQSDYAVGKEERMHRAQMKKQLCVHLIKMGQLTQAFLSTANTGALVNNRSIDNERQAINRSDPQSSGETDSVFEDGDVGRKYSALKKQGKVRTLMRDQSTSTEPNYETIIDIDTDHSEVSV